MGYKLSKSISEVIKYILPHSPIGYCMEISWALIIFKYFFFYGEAAGILTTCMVPTHPLNINYISYSFNWLSENEPLAVKWLHQFSYLYLSYLCN